jgi:hypothetical protein
MLAKFATAQQQQQRLHKGHGAAPRAGTAAGSSGAEQVRSVKGVQGYADAPFDPTKGLAAIYDACETALLKAAGASPSPAASASTHQHARSAEQTQQRSATAAKLLSVVNKTAGSSSRSPLANVGAGGGAGAAASPWHGHRQGIGSDRLSRDAVTEQMQAMNAHVRAAHNYLADGDEGDSAAPQDVATAVALAINQPPPATAHDEEESSAVPEKKRPRTDEERDQQRLRNKLVRRERPAHGRVARDGDASDNDVHPATISGAPPMATAANPEDPAEQAGVSSEGVGGTAAAPLAAKKTAASAAEAARLRALYGNSFKKRR